MSQGASTIASFVAASLCEAPAGQRTPNVTHAAHRAAVTEEGGEIPT
jgi:hypothetical protein